MNAEIKNNKLIITIDLDKEPKLSASGKSLVVASTRGNFTSEVKIDGKPVIIAVNAYTKA